MTNQRNRWFLSTPEGLRGTMKHLFAGACIKVSPLLCSCCSVIRRSAHTSPHAYTWAPSSPRHLVITPPGASGMPALPSYHPCRREWDAETLFLEPSSGAGLLVQPRPGRAVRSLMPPNPNPSTSTRPHPNPSTSTRPHPNPSMKPCPLLSR